MNSSLTHTESAILRVASPTAFPMPGTYHVTQRVTLLCSTPGAVIHYTMDGATPTGSSSVYDPYKLPVLEAVNDGDRGVKTTYTLKAIARKEDLLDSEVATFTYTIDRRSKDVYVTKEIHPGVCMILDFDDTKMILITGSKRALLIDTGLGAGDLRGYVAGLIGELPLDVAITHAHPDHIALMGQFQGHHDVYMHPADLPLVRNFIQRLNYHIDPTRIIDLREGFTFDLGDRTLTVYEVPGHSAGSIVLFDEENGLLFAGDALGSNRPTIVDSLWLQRPGMAKVDVYLSTLQAFRSKVRGGIQEIYSGHNDVPLYGEAYLDNLQRAAQDLVDQGEDILLPSLRPTDVWQVVVGDRMSDPNWAAINVTKGSCLSASPEQLATLSNLQVKNAQLDSGFTPLGFQYTIAVDASVTDLEITATAMSSRIQNMTINGAPIQSGAAQKVLLQSGDNTFVITVTSPDGSVKNAYTLVVTKAQA